jgi:hypothetical protein
MSFLYSVDGKLIHHNPISSDAMTSEEWENLSKFMIPNFSWDTYTSTIKNIRIYKGITSTLKFVNYYNAQLEHSEEIVDDPKDEKEWSTISKYMIPSVSWETYTSTIQELGNIEKFNDLNQNILKDLDFSKNIFNIKNKETIDNIGEWVVYVRDLTNLLSTPSVIMRDYNATLMLYPQRPSTIFKEEFNLKEHIGSELKSTLIMFSTSHLVPTNDALISSIKEKFDYNYVSSFINNDEIQLTISSTIIKYF